MSNLPHVNSVQMFGIVDKPPRVLSRPESTRLVVAWTIRTDSEWTDKQGALHHNTTTLQWVAFGDLATAIHEHDPEYPCWMAAHGRINTRVTQADEDCVHSGHFLTEAHAIDAYFIDEAPPIIDRVA